MKTLKDAVEMVADSSVRFMPAQPSFGRTKAVIKVSTGAAELTSELTERCQDALRALGCKRALVIAVKETYGVGTISQGYTYTATIVPQ